MLGSEEKLRPRCGVLGDMTEYSVQHLTVLMASDVLAGGLRVIPTEEMFEIILAIQSQQLLYLVDFVSSAPPFLSAPSVYFLGWGSTLPAFSYASLRVNPFLSSVEHVV